MNTVSQELRSWVAMQSARLSRLFPSATKREEILARLAKLTEEVGELADEVLSYDKHQRKEKLAEKDIDALKHEFADVIITTLLLAEEMHVDIPSALDSKIAKINERFEKIEQGE